MYRRGIIDAHDVDTHRVRVRYLDRDDVLSPWLEVTVPSTHDDVDECLPPIGNQVACVLDEREESGCVIGAVHSHKDPPLAKSASVRRTTMRDGAEFEYDTGSGVLRITLPSAGFVHLAGADAFLALASHVDAELQKIKTALDSHVHPAGALISAAPLAPVTGATAPATSGYSPASTACAQVKSA